MKLERYYIKIWQHIINTGESNSNEMIQLFMLPYAGGDHASFNKILPYLNKNIEPVTIEYSGRGNRRKETFIKEYQKFLDDISVTINVLRRPDCPYALLGYSLGSAVAFDLLSKHRILGVPKHAFFCARGSLKVKTESQSYHLLSDTEFIKVIKDLGGIDDRILSNPRFLDIFMRPIKADYSIWGQYTHPDNNAKIPCNMSIIYSPQDPLSDNIEDWCEMTEKESHFYEIGNNHFFILQHYKELADIINRELESYEI